MSALVSTSLIDRSSLMPAHFLDELDASNRQKKPGTPLALIFQSKKDESGAITSLCSQYCYDQIAQTHRIAVKVIESYKEIPTEITRIREQTQSKIDCIILNGHGSPNPLITKYSDIVFSGNSRYGIEVAKEDVFSGEASKIPLLLIACQTASFAKYLSIIQGRDVYAPIENLLPNFTHFSYCPKHLRLEMSSFSKEENHVNLFCNGVKADTSNCSKKTSKEVEADFSAYINKRDDGSLTGQDLIKLADCFRTGDHNFPQSEEIGFLVYKRALILLEKESANNNSVASCLLGFLYWQGHGVKQCLKMTKLYFELSSLQGLTHAKNLLDDLNKLPQVDKKIA